MEACATSSRANGRPGAGEEPMASWQVGNNALDLAASLDLINQTSLTCVSCMTVIGFEVSNSPAKRQ